MSGDFRDVGMFHDKFGLKSQAGWRVPQCLDPATRDFRVGFLLEEMKELCEGYGLKLEFTLEPVAGQPPDLPKIADALVDLVYMALGTAHLHNLPWPQLFAEVQRANMSKERAKNDGSNSARKSSLDVIKPAGWTPPDIARVLLKAGWPGPELPLTGPESD